MGEPDVNAARESTSLLGRIGDLLGGGVEHALVKGARGRQPLSPRGCAETALEAYASLDDSWELQAANVHSILNVTSHPRFIQWSQKLHVLHVAGRGYIDFTQRRDLFIEFAVLIHELYFGVRQCEPHTAHMHLGVVLDACDAEAGRPANTTRPRILAHIGNGDADAALSCFREAYSGARKAWDFRYARECMGIDGHGAAREEMAGLLAEKINHVLATTHSRNRVSGHAVYSELETVMELYMKRRFDRIESLIGTRAWR